MTDIFHLSHRSGRLARSCALLLFSLHVIYGQENTDRDPFRQLGQELPTPNIYRTASGAPGHGYWQQRADYDIEVELRDDRQQIHGKETITYYNESPDVLNYIWVQLDQNVRAKDAESFTTMTFELVDSVEFKDFRKLHHDFDGGFKIDWVKGLSEADLPYVVNRTMMRVDLPSPLQPGDSFSFRIKWWYNINDRMKMGGRSGYEYFSEDGNYLYTIAQFYPRVAMYNDVYGWQHKQFLGNGEFTLVFGNFRVRITAPSDHVVAATGELQNPRDVLTEQQRTRLQRARSATEPLMVITEAEARENGGNRQSGKKTWEFFAENVRDFAFVSSRKFIWDAMGVFSGDRQVMAMSYYPPEGNPLWERYSTRVVAHTLKWYSHYTFDYPYPVAISVHTDRIGMEYPMICFNGGRPEKDGTYSERTKYGMISVIIHEVGHNYFPMIVNSDERQWTWMDEGLNSFLQYLTEQAWQREYPSRRGPPLKIIDYMKGPKDKIAPIMTNSESIHQFGNNAYGKPATALNILRETILGRELFDFAFREYSQRWMFRHPTPADFFRTMEDASGTDLDWFWRGWFYTTDHVDIGIDRVDWYKVDTRDPAIEKPIARKREEDEPTSISDQRNQSAIPKTVVEADGDMADFYNKFDRYAVTYVDEEKYASYLKPLEEWQKELLGKELNYYQVTFHNHGGLVMPLILELEFDGGRKLMRRIAAEIWRYNADSISWILATEKELRSIALDPLRETADVDISNNFWPPRPTPSRFKLYKKREEPLNPMQIDKRAKAQKGR